MDARGRGEHEGKLALSGRTRVKNGANLVDPWSHSDFLTLLPVEGLITLRLYWLVSPLKCPALFPSALVWWIATTERVLPAGFRKNVINPDGHRMNGETSPRCGA